MAIESKLSALPRPTFGLTYLDKDDRRPLKGPFDATCPRRHLTYPVIVPSGRIGARWCLCLKGSDFNGL